MPSSSRIAVPARLVIGLELFVSVGAFYGSWLGLSDPSGVSYGLPAAQWLIHAPFDDWFFPSLILLAVNALFPLVVVASILRRRAWAAQATVAHGVFLAGWIAVQVALLRVFYAPLHAPFFLLGLLVAGLGALGLRAGSRAVVAR